MWKEKEESAMTIVLMSVIDSDGVTDRSREH
jgi:hypothetical protein